MIKYTTVLGILIALTGLIITFFTGAGGLQRMTTLSGVYVVKNPSGYQVTCFIDKNSGGMQCIPNAAIATCKEVLNHIE